MKSILPTGRLLSVAARGRGDDGRWTAGGRSSQSYSKLEHSKHLGSIGSFSLVLPFSWLVLLGLPWKVLVNFMNLLDFINLPNLLAIMANPSVHPHHLFLHRNKFCSYLWQLWGKWIWPFWQEMVSKSESGEMGAGLENKSREGVCARWERVREREVKKNQNKKIEKQYFK